MSELGRIFHVQMSGEIKSYRGIHTEAIRSILLFVGQTKPTTTLRLWRRTMRSFNQILEEITGAKWTAEGTTGCIFRCVSNGVLAVRFGQWLTVGGKQYNLLQMGCADLIAT